MKKLITVLCLLICGSTCFAQSKKIDRDMVNFFTGTWTGKGEFANGKPIEADVIFTRSVDSACLISMYADKAPNVYKAAAVFGIDASTGKFYAHFINNFSGLKEFTSDGWHNDKIVLANQEDYSGKGTMYQQFIYEKIDTDHFKATYKYGTDSLNLKQGDYLIFTKVQANK